MDALIALPALHTHVGGSQPLRGASLPLALKPIPASDTAAALLPALALAPAPVARVVALHRQLLAEALGTAEVGEGAPLARRCSGTSLSVALTVNLPSP